MSRPKLDPAVTQRIVDLIRAGNYLEVAATAAGVHRVTLHRWLRYGRKQARGRYRKFVDAVEKAQAEAESRDVALIAKAAGEDWRAAAWRLERARPASMARACRSPCMKSSTSRSSGSSRGSRRRSISRCSSCSLPRTRCSWTPEFLLQWSSWSRARAQRIRRDDPGPCCFSYSFR